MKAILITFAILLLLLTLLATLGGSIKTNYTINNFVNSTATPSEHKTTFIPPVKTAGESTITPPVQISTAPILPPMPVPPPPTISEVPQTTEHFVEAFDLDNSYAKF